MAFEKPAGIARNLFCNPPNGGGISKVLVFLYSDNNPKTIILDKTYTIPINKIDLSEKLNTIDTMLLRNQEIQIQIWNNSPIIFDYGIDIKPNDWTEKKVIKGWWNAR